MTPAGETELRRKIEAGSEDVADYCRLAELLEREQRHEATVRVYEQALGLRLDRTTRAEVLTRLSRVQYTVFGQCGKALALAEQAVALLSGGPETGEVWAVRGVGQALATMCLANRSASAAEESARQALADLERAGPAAGKRPEVLRWTAQMHLLLEQPEEAIAWGTRYLAAESEPAARTDFLTVLAQAYRTAGRLEEAERTLTEAQFRIDCCKHAAAGLYHEQGLVWRALGRGREARVALERALGAAVYREDVSSAEARVSLGELSYEEGDYTGAAGQFEKVLELIPEDSEWRRYALVWLGRCRVELGLCADARVCFAEVLASPEASEQDQVEAQRGALYAEAQQRYQSGDLRAAAKAYQKILEQNPDDDEFRRTMLLWLADCHARLQEPTEARSCYEQILSSPEAGPEEQQRALSELATLPPAARRWVQ